MRVDHTNSGLKEGQFFEITDVDDVPHGVHVDVEKMWPEEFTIAAGRRMRDTFMAKIVTEWSFGAPPNGDPDALRSLPRAPYRELLAATNAHYIDAGFMVDPDEGKEQAEKSTSGPSNSSE